MLAARLPSTLPPLTPAELLEVSMIASVAGKIEGVALTNQGPFRSPHHSAIMPRWWAAACGSSPAKSRLPITACCSWDELPGAPRYYVAISPRRSGYRKPRALEKLWLGGRKMRTGLCFSPNPIPCG
jgi:hypothetical protein